jgi:hypothetical protein
MYFMLNIWIWKSLVRSMCRQTPVFRDIWLKASLPTTIFSIILLGYATGWFLFPCNLVEPRGRWSGSENIVLSNKKIGENPMPRKPKVSFVSIPIWPPRVVYCLWKACLPRGESCLWSSSLGRRKGPTYQFKMEMQMNYRLVNSN